MVSLKKKKLIHGKNHLHTLDKIQRDERHKLVERGEDKFWCERIQISNSKKQHDVWVEHKNL